MITATKICSRCGQLKPLSEFWKKKDCKYGLRPSCKICKKAELRKWRAAHPDQTRESQKRWRLKNLDKAREFQRKCYMKRRSTIKGKLDHRMSVRIQQSLKNSKRSQNWELLVGYTVNDLKQHLQKQFTGNMTWEKLMEGEIHIDHKIPIVAFNYSKPDDYDFKRCWSLDNLQPMWAQDNRSKKARLDKPFQPSFIYSRKEGR